MRLPSNFLARLKDITRRKSRGFGNESNQIVRQWFLVLLFSVFTVVLVAGYGVYRFNYWSSIEERVEREEVRTAEYDEEAIERILKEFRDKEETSAIIIGAPLPKPSTSVDTNTKRQPTESGDASPALGQ
ncbi:hypothetical protein H6789_02395 [Candidatus Nomurabacteria bacterium]|nr:hypothetical protein [Candidatus Nomurabacteria bacterium]